MKIETKHSIGDAVYLCLTDETEEIKTECPHCKGQGYIMLNGGKFTCNNCISGYNYKYIHRYYPTKTHIGQIIINVLKDGTVEERYQTRATGVGSGALLKIEEIYTNKDECTVQCDKLNKQMSV